MRQTSHDGFMFVAYIGQAADAANATQSPSSSHVFNGILRPSWEVSSEKQRDPSLCFRYSKRSFVVGTGGVSLEDFLNSDVEEIIG